MITRAMFICHDIIHGYTTRKWAQSGYLCTTPSTAQAGADAGISWS